MFSTNVNRVETTCSDTMFFSELIITQLREFHMVSPQVVSTLLIFLTMQSYKVYQCKYRQCISIFSIFLLTTQPNKLNIGFYIYLSIAINAFTDILQEVLTALEHDLIEWCLIIQWLTYTFDGHDSLILNTRLLWDRTKSTT